MLNQTIRLLIREFFDQKISSIGLITAHNPQYEQRSEEENKNMNDLLLQDLQELGIEPFPTYHYGEHGYLCPGISKQNLINLGKKYNQFSVVWGEKIPEDRNGMTFSWQYLKDGKVRAENISHHPFVVPNFDHI